MVHLERILPASLCLTHWGANSCRRESGGSQRGKPPTHGLMGIGGVVAHSPLPHHRTCVPQISRDKFDRSLRATTEFTLCILDRYGLRDPWPARPTLTLEIRFLYIGSRFCSTLLSDPASRRRPCASLSLLLYQDVKRTLTSQLSTMLGVPRKSPDRSRGLWMSEKKAGES